MIHLLENFASLLNAPIDSIGPYSYLSGMSKSIRIGFFLLIAASLNIFSAAGQSAQTSPSAESSNASKAFETDLRYAQVRNVEMEENADGTWNFSVTVEHADTGWDHYANLWQIIDGETGRVIAERVLAHPHVEAQPFSRSLRNIELSDDLRFLVVRARCNEHGYRGKQVRIDRRILRGEDYRIYRDW
jgi:hypothetical protein